MKEWSPFTWSENRINTADLRNKWRIISKLRKHCGMSASEIVKLKVTEDGSGKPAKQHT